MMTLQALATAKREKRNKEKASTDRDEHHGKHIVLVTLKEKCEPA